MGGKLSTLTSFTPPSKRYILPWTIEANLTVPLNTARFLKSYYARDTHSQQEFIVKVFTKPEQIDLSVYKYVLSHYREVINRCCPHVVPYIAEQETRAHGFLLRPMLFQSLPEFLMQNQWITRGHKVLYSMQMILAVAEMHTAGLVHGDIKLSNFLVTRTYDIMLTDYAPYKPYQVSMGNPISLSYYFTDIIAPERIVQTEQDMDTILVSTPEVDVFSLGAALIELWTSTKPFDLPTLFEYMGMKSGEIIDYIESLLEGIEHGNLRELVRTMISPVPSQRVNLCTLQMSTIFTPEEFLSSKILLMFRSFINAHNLDDVVHIAATIFDGICDIYTTDSPERKMLTKCYFCDVRQKIQMEHQRDEAQHSDRKVATMTRVSSTINISTKNRSLLIGESPDKWLKLQLQQCRPAFEMPSLCSTNLDIPFKVIESLDATVLRSLATCDCMQRVIREGGISEISWNCNTFGPFRRILASDTLQAAMYHIAYSLMRLIQSNSFTISTTYKKSMLLVCSYALFMDDSYVSHLVRMAYRVFRLRPTRTTLSGITYLFHLLTSASTDIYYIPLLVLGEVFLPKSQQERFFKAVETARHQLMRTAAATDGFLSTISSIFLYTAGTQDTIYPYLINHYHVMELFPLLLAAVARLSNGDRAIQTIVDTILLKNKTSLLYNMLRATTITPIALSSITAIAGNLSFVATLLPGIVPLCLDFVRKVTVRELKHVQVGTTVAALLQSYLGNLATDPKKATPLSLLFRDARDITAGENIFAFLQVFLESYHPLRDEKVTGSVFLTVVRFLPVLPLAMQARCLYLLCKFIFLPSVLLVNTDAENQLVWSPGKYSTWLLLDSIRAVVDTKSVQDAMLFSLFFTDFLGNYINGRLAGAIVTILSYTVQSFKFATRGASQLPKAMIRKHAKQEIGHGSKSQQFWQALLSKLAPIIPRVMEHVQQFYSEFSNSTSFDADASVHHDMEYDAQSSLLHEIKTAYAAVERLTLASFEDLRAPNRMAVLLQAAIQGTYLFLRSMVALVKAMARTMGMETKNLLETHEKYLALNILVDDICNVESADQSVPVGSVKRPGLADLSHSVRDSNKIGLLALQKTESRSVVTLTETSMWNDGSTSWIMGDEHSTYKVHGAERTHHTSVCNGYHVLLRDQERAVSILELYYGPIGDAPDRIEQMLLGTFAVAKTGAANLASVQPQTYTLITDSGSFPDDSVLHSTLYQMMIINIKPLARALAQRKDTGDAGAQRISILSEYSGHILNIQPSLTTRSWFPYLKKSSIPPSALPAVLDALLNSVLIVSPGTHALPTVDSFLRHIYKGTSCNSNSMPSTCGLGYPKSEFITLPDLQNSISSLPLNLLYSNPFAYSKDSLVKHILADIRTALEFTSMRASSKGDLILSSKTIQGMQSSNSLYTHYSNLMKSASELIIKASITHYINKTAYRSLLPMNSAEMNYNDGNMDCIGVISGKTSYAFTVENSTGQQPSMMQTHSNLHAFAYSAIGNIFVTLDTNNYLHFYMNPVDESIKFLVQKILLLSTSVSISITSSPDTYIEHCNFLKDRLRGQNMEERRRSWKTVDSKIDSHPGLESLEGTLEYLSTGVLTLPLATLHIPGAKINDIFVEKTGIPIIGGGKASEKKSVRHELFVLNLVTDGYILKLLVDTDMLVQQYAEMILVPHSSSKAPQSTGVAFSVNDMMFSLVVQNPTKGAEPVDFGALHKSQLHDTLNENVMHYLLPYVSTGSAETMLKSAYQHLEQKMGAGHVKPMNIHVQSTLSTALDKVNSVSTLLADIGYKHQLPLRRSNEHAYSVTQRQVLTYYNCFYVTDIVSILSTTIVTSFIIYNSATGKHVYTLPDNLGRIIYACESYFGNIAVLTSLYWLIILEPRAGSLIALCTLTEKHRYNVYKYPIIVDTPSSEENISDLGHEASFDAMASRSRSTQIYIGLVNSMFVSARGSTAYFYHFDNRMPTSILRIVGVLSIRMLGRGKGHADEHQPISFSSLSSYKNGVVLGLSNGAVLMVQECKKEAIHCRMLSSPNKYRITSNVDLTATDKTFLDDCRKLSVTFKAQSSAVLTHQLAHHQPVVSIRTCGCSIFSADSSGNILFFH